MDIYLQRKVKQFKMLEIETISKEEFDNKIRKKSASDVVLEPKDIVVGEGNNFLDKSKEEHERLFKKIIETTSVNEQQEDLNNLTMENLKLIKLVWSEKQEIKNASPKIFKAFRESNRYNHELELKEIATLSSTLDESIGKMHKLTADLFRAMFTGVLIPDQVSIRDHKICPFRCQYRINDSDFFNMLRQTSNQEAILKTLTKCEQQKIAKQLFEIIKILDDNKEIVNDRNGRQETALDLPLDKPFLFIDKSDDITFYVITDISIRDYRVFFQGWDLLRNFDMQNEQEALEFLSKPTIMEDFKTSKDLDSKHSISINEGNYNYFINNFGEYIVKISKELEKMYAFKIAFVDKAIVQIQNIGSKYLIADQLLRENS